MLSRLNSCVFLLISFLFLFVALFGSLRLISINMAIISLTENLKLWGCPYSILRSNIWRRRLLLPLFDNYDHFFICFFFSLLFGAIVYIVIVCSIITIFMYIFKICVLKFQTVEGRAITTVDLQCRCLTRNIHASYFCWISSAEFPSISMHRISIEFKTGLISLLHLLEQMIQTNSNFLIFFSSAYFCFRLWLLHTIFTLHLIHINFDSDPSYISVIKHECFFFFFLWIFDIDFSEFYDPIEMHFWNWCRCHDQPVRIFIDSLPDWY